MHSEIVHQDFLNAAMQHLKLAVTPGNAIIRIAMGPEGTNFAFIELRSEEVRVDSCRACMAFWSGGGIRG